MTLVHIYNRFTKYLLLGTKKYTFTCSGLNILSNNSEILVQVSSWSTSYNHHMAYTKINKFKIVHNIIVIHVKKCICIT